ncbi:MAG: class I SAM-dependent methyltransferase [Spirochaetaceae bacterium]|nr:class I SAM-dependent methyltransferase [Spirochaetaceae bacterium]
MATESRQEARVKRASTTAILAAAIRASHLRWHQPPIVADTYAIHMITFFWRLVATNWALNRLFVHRLLKLFKPVHTENILRPRFAEDHLREAIAAGARQYVILGAGLDSFCLRQGDLADRLRIFEVDHPASQSMKRDKLLKINDHLPANLVFTPVDFETEHLDDALTRAGYDTSVPAFFSWLGTTYYLTRDAIRDTLDRVAAVAAPGTRIALDYKYPRHLVPDDGLLFADKLDQFVARRGEPMLSMFTPDELNAEFRRAGFTELDHVSPEQQAQRYLEGRTDMTAPAPNFALALFAA